MQEREKRAVDLIGLGRIDWPESDLRSFGIEPPELQLQLQIVGSSKDLAVSDGAGRMRFAPICSSESQLPLPLLLRTAPANCSCRLHLPSVPAPAPANCTCRLLLLLPSAPATCLLLLPSAFYLLTSVFFGNLSA